MQSSFDFTDTLPDQGAGGRFVLKVPASIQSKEDLLKLLACLGRFPGYFGHNWDALLDCLRDFDWIEEKEIVIAHSDVPLSAYPIDRRIYLEILRDAVNDWALADDPDRAPSGHRLRVIFPTVEKRIVVGALA